MCVRTDKKQRFVICSIDMADGVVDDWIVGDEHYITPSAAACALYDIYKQLAGACECAWNQLVQACDGQLRKLEYRQIQADNDIAESVAELRSVKASVNARLIELRAECDSNESKVLTLAASPKTRPDACVHFRLKTLYEAQYKHTQLTLSAIEAHIVALEATAVNRRVVRALRKGASCATPQDEDDAADTIDDLADQYSTTTRIMQILSAPPNLTVLDNPDEETAADAEMSAWLLQQQHGNNEDSKPPVITTNQGQVQQGPVEAHNEVATSTFGYYAHAPTPPAAAMGERCRTNGQPVAA